MDAVQAKAQKLNIKRFTSRKWNSYEINFLIKHYGKNSNKVISKILKRDRISILNQAQKLNLSAKVRLWTNEDINFLKNNFNSMDRKDLAIHLDRTVSSVRSKAGKLKLTLPLFFTPEEDKFLIKNYKKMSYKEMGKALGRSKMATFMHFKKLGLKKGTKRKWNDEEDSFLKNNYTKYPNSRLAVMMNRSIQAVNYRAFKLKVSKPYKNFKDYK